MAIIFNVLPPDEATVNASRIPDGSFFRPVGKRKPTSATSSPLIQLGCGRSGITTCGKDQTGRKENIDHGKSHD